MAVKDINIVGSFVGKGLEREALLLQDLLKKHDVYVNFYHYTNFANANFVRADISIFLEVVMVQALNLSRENWFFPNSEWHAPQNDQFLPRFTKILCKTRDCQRIWSAKLANDRPERVIYTGFESRDLFDLSVEREDRFLHAAGESEFKNTEAVINAWKAGNWVCRKPPLTVLTRQKKFQDMCEGVPEITCIERVPEEDLVKMFNSHRFHIMPSAYEGFGHSLNESLGVGALVVTTAAPPMDEFAGIVPEWTVRVSQKTPRSLAQLSHVAPIDVILAVQKVIADADASEERMRWRQEHARNSFLASRDSFRKTFLSLVGVN